MVTKSYTNAKTDTDTNVIKMAHTDIEREVERARNNGRNRNEYGDSNGAANIHAP